MSDGVQDLLGDRAFGMDPHATLLTLARQFVAGQRMLAAMQRGAQTARAASPDAPEAVALCEEFERVKTAWHTKRLPNLAASMRLAIEVFDTFGPGLARVDDDTEAAIWNNKFFVWLNEFSVAPTQ
jgi:hypothetical protein